MTGGAARAARPLALHQITMRDVAPLRLADLAARHGFGSVCLFTHVPAVTLTGGGAAVFPLVTAANRKAMRQSLRDAGVSVTQFEYFPIRADTPIEAYREAMALGAELGGRRAVTHIHDTDENRAIDRLGQLADLAHDCGVGLALEFMGLSPACGTLAAALRFVEQVGRDNLGVGIDALHLVRSGGSVADISAVPAHRLLYAQICDGAGLHASTTYAHEALDRMMPGTGDFPLVPFLRALPATTDLDVEVPWAAHRQAEVPPDARAAQAYARTMELIERAASTG